MVPLAAGIEAGQSGTTDPSKNALDLFIPAIYSAWQWKPSGTPAKPSGSCPPCDGKQGSFDCAYIFPCYSDEGDVSGWGHRDTSVGGVPRINFLVAGCNTHLPNGMLATTTQHKHFCACSFSSVGLYPNNTHNELQRLARLHATIQSQIDQTQCVRRLIDRFWVTI
eukprot:COSAG06_NODE_3_length_43832_cov_136.908399_15_plen_166_part_00